MIDAQRLRDGWLVWLPLPPSTNRRMRPVIMGRHARMILTAEARDYLEANAMDLHQWARSVRFKPLVTFTGLDWWVIPRSAQSDGHNFEKIMLDLIEKARLVENDRLLLPRMQGVFYDAKQPALIINFPQERI